MKRISYLVMVLMAAILMASCGGGKKEGNTEEYNANESAAEKAEPVDVIAQGEALVKSSDCKTCHHLSGKIIGPSHTDVAKKYEFTNANVKMLAGKIIKGGSGVWGEIPMSPHADITEADAEKMARYVLSLDGEKEH